MITLLDSSLWVDFTRARSPRALKEMIAPYILHPTAHLAEPIVFELLRHATPKEASQLKQHFATMPLLPTPTDLWHRAAVLGQQCRAKGHSAGSLDLLIAAVAQAHGAVLITLDEDFETIGKAVGMMVKLLRRPAV